MTTQRRHIESEAWMPLHAARERTGLAFDLGSFVAGIENQRFNIVCQAERPVHVRLNMVVEQVPRVIERHRYQ